MMEPGGVTAAPYMGTQGLEQSPPIDREPPVLAPHPKYKTRDSPPFFLFPFPFSLSFSSGIFCSQEQTINTPSS